MRARSAGAIGLLALIVLAPAANAKDTPPVTVVDLFHDVGMGELQFETSCDQVPNAISEFVVDEANRTFRFLEGQAASPQFDLEGRIAYVGCGLARFQADLPEGTDHVHVRFAADRTIDAQASDLTYNFTQVLRVAFDGGQATSMAYYGGQDSTQALTAFDPPAIKVPSGARGLTVEWYFRDQGSMNGLRIVSNVTGAPNPASTHALSASVAAPVIEYSGHPLPGTVSHRTRVIEDKESLQTRVRMTVDEDLLEGFHVNLRAEVDQSLHLVAVVAPNGTRLAQFTSNPLAGTAGFQPYGPAGTIPLVEPRIDFYRATLPGEAVAAYGPGTYTFIFAKDIPLDAPTPLIALALLVLALPFVMGVRALYGVQSFRREAFGLYKKAATGLLAGVLLVLAYYLAFVIQILLQSQHILMAHWPVTARSALLYVNVGLAIAGLAAFGLVGRRLHDITRPARK
ncbi:MAG: hypothetical protein AABY18_08595 [Candidatus Thermoplasmatota archaeon]